MLGVGGRRRQYNEEKEVEPLKIVYFSVMMERREMKNKLAILVQLPWVE